MPSIVEVSSAEMKVVHTGQGEREVSVQVRTACRVIAAGREMWLRHLKRGDHEEGLEE